MVLEQGQVESSAIYTHRAVSLVHPFLVLKSLSVYAYTQLYKVCSPSHVTNCKWLQWAQTHLQLYISVLWILKLRIRTLQYTNANHFLNHKKSPRVLEKFSKYWSGASVKHEDWSMISKEMDTFPHQPQTPITLPLLSLQNSNTVFLNISAIQKFWWFYTDNNLKLMIINSNTSHNNNIHLRCQCQTGESRAAILHVT